MNDLLKVVQIGSRQIETANDLLKVGQVPIQDLHKFVYDALVCDRRVSRKKKTILEKQVKLTETFRGCSLETC